MKMMSIFVAAALISACSSGSSSKSSSSGDVGQEPEVNDCAIVMNNLVLANGESCTLSEADASLFSVSSGLVECSAGQITYNGNIFQSGANGLSFGSLSFICGS